MKSDLNLISIVIIALLIYIGYLTRYFLPNYFKVKAENLAKLQDLEKLTVLVREIEFKFEERTQNLKAKLDLSNQLQFGLDNEERIILIKLHNNINEYYNFLTDLSFNGIDFHDNNSIKRHMNERNIKNDSLFVLKNNAMLFLDEEYGLDVENAIYNVIDLFNEVTIKYTEFCHTLIRLNNSNNIDTQLKEIHLQYTKQIIEIIKVLAPQMQQVTKTIKVCLNNKVKSLDLK